MKNKIEIFIYENFTKIFYATIFIFVFCALTFSQQAGIGSSALKKHNHSGDSQGGSIQALKLTGNFFIEGNNEGNIVMPSTPATGSNFIYYPAKSSLYAGFTNTANSWYVKDVANTINLGSYNQCGNYSTCIGYGVSVGTTRYNSHTFGNYLKTAASNAITIGQGNVSTYPVNTERNSIRIYNDNVLKSGKPIISISSYGVVNINDQLIVSTSAVEKGAGIDTSKAITFSSSVAVAEFIALNERQVYNPNISYKGFLANSQIKITTIPVNMRLGDICEIYFTLAGTHLSSPTTDYYFNYSVNGELQTSGFYYTQNMRINNTWNHYGYSEGAKNFARGTRDVQVGKMELRFSLMVDSEAGGNVGARLSYYSVANSTSVTQWQYFGWSLVSFNSNDVVDNIYIYSTGVSNERGAFWPYCRRRNGVW